ncbi:MAG: hypothetical protein COT81_05725 [Candidatus Buchananbacteria bacterium CG10_big_fil_rev_8_21_14_0_10_42_9]|uniref:Uncharacterized protein n=1 Tax=Candidatus Buchananbacteria bacterium CG10_big_fil_rev_8_21_14_0_10_42_9 TaxID=1974526 RepID=A0A2H0VZP6_9BACT|nr:MAG: hypothetical protein COT81_05725 [Candidatus Buchananbacteria bacterium CG10_big_fil_rev_8_21_14_0_10_42_9]
MYRSNFILATAAVLISFNFLLISPAISTDGSSAEGSGSVEGGIDNPLGKGLNDPRDIIANIIRAILGLVGSLALLVFIYGGFTWMMAAGNEDKIKKGKDMILWASLGIAVILLSYTLVSFVIGAITGV